MTEYEAVGYIVAIKIKWSDPKDRKERDRRIIDIARKFAIENKHFNLAQELASD